MQISYGKLRGHVFQFAFVTSTLMDLILIISSPRVLTRSFGHGSGAARDLVVHFALLRDLVEQHGVLALILVRRQLDVVRLRRTVDVLGAVDRTGENGGRSR